MELQHIISQPLEFFGGTVILPLYIEGLPPQVAYNDEIYHLKGEFHSSLICVKCIQKSLPDREEGILGRQILEQIEAARKEHEPSMLGYRDELRHVQRDDNQTIVIMTDITNLEPIFEVLRAKYEITIPSQPTHVTLYSTKPNMGIGIPSQEALETITTVISDPKLIELKAAMNFNKVFGDKL